MTRAAASLAAEPSLSPAREIARLARGGGDPGSFLVTLLEGQCRMAPAVTGALVRVDDDAPVQVVARFPDSGGPGAPTWIAYAAGLARPAIGSGKITVHPLEETHGLDAPVAQPQLLLVPVPAWRGKGVVAAYIVDAVDEATLLRVRDRLEITAGLLGLYDLHLKLHAREQIADRLRTAMVVLEAVNEQDRFRAAAMALCNEVAARWRGERVTLGFLDGRYVKTAAISHTEKFDRKMTLVQDIEAAMEECLDQDTEVIHPRPDAAIYVSRATEQLSLRHGPLSVANLPLRRGGKAIGVLTLERRIDDPPLLEDVEMLRLTCELATPRLVDLRRHDRWIGARAATSVTESLRGVLGPRHTGRKIITIALTALLGFLVFARGEDRVDAAFEIAAIERRVVPAPFDGHIETIGVKPGDVVLGEDTVLGSLDTADLQMQLAAAQAEHAGYLKESDLALRDGNTVEVQIAEAHLRRIDAEIELLEHRIAQATILAPIDGTIVAGDLEDRLGAPVKTGDVLFEVAKLDGFRAELNVPEDRIADLMGPDGTWGLQRGELASVTHPGDRIPFEIEHINPVAEVIDQRNVFRARVRLLEHRPWLRPGMKGVAKVGVGRRSYGYLWTRKIVSWLRMQFWV